MTCLDNLCEDEIRMIIPFCQSPKPLFDAIGTKCDRLELEWYRKMDKFVTEINGKSFNDHYDQVKVTLDEIQTLLDIADRNYDLMIDNDVLYYLAKDRDFWTDNKICRCILYFNEFTKPHYCNVLEFCKWRVSYN